MSDIRQLMLRWWAMLRHMVCTLDAFVERFTLSSKEFERTLRSVRPEQWTLATPCAEWNVRQLVNHATRGNLNYVRLAEGGTSADFLRLREHDALGADPLAAYAGSVRGCAEAFARPGVLDRVLDHPLGRITGRQALAVRTTDNTIHTWDLARAIGTDDTLHTGLVTWIDEHLHDIYAGLAETPTAERTTHRFFAQPQGTPARDASRQARLLHRMGRNPERAR